MIDLSSLGIKRNIESAQRLVQEKSSQVRQSTALSAAKKKNESGFLEFIKETDCSNEDYLDPDDDEMFENGKVSSEYRKLSESENSLITEEEFLKQHNLNIKNQLLNSSSSESDEEKDESDIEFPLLNGQKNRKRKKKYSIDSDDVDSDDSSASSIDSYKSVINEYLEKISDKEKIQEDKVSNIENTVGNVILNNSDSSSNKEIAGDEKTASHKNSKVALKPFDDIDKVLNASLSSEDESKSMTVSPRADILDTTMFKQKQVDIDSNKLSEMLAVSAKRKTPISNEVQDECISLSSDDDLEMGSIPISAESKETAAEDSGDQLKDRTVRKLLRSDQLAGETKKAQREESERVKRLEKKNKRLQQIIKEQKENSSKQQQDSEDIIEVVEDVILDYDSKKKQQIIVHRDILKHLKPHQIDGIKFMYDCCYGSVDTLDQFKGSGCILAHCMGLGKTLQLISLLHTVISYPQLQTTKVLVICPKSTVLNWKEEIERWLGPIKDGRNLKLYQFPDQS